MLLPLCAVIFLTATSANNKQRALGSLNYAKTGQRVYVVMPTVTWSATALKMLLSISFWIFLGILKSKVCTVLVSIPYFQLEIMAE